MVVCIICIAIPNDAEQNIIFYMLVDKYFYVFFGTWKMKIHFMDQLLSNPGPIFYSQYSNEGMKNNLWYFICLKK
jgi:hypothetical protein